MRYFIAYFQEGVFLVFEAACEVGAREYAWYRAALRGEKLLGITEITNGKATELGVDARPGGG